MDPDRFRVSLRAIFAAIVTEIPDQFLFLGVDRDHRLLLGQCGGHLGVGSKERGSGRRASSTSDGAVLMEDPRQEEEYRGTQRSQRRPRGIPDSEKDLEHRGVCVFEKRSRTARSHTRANFSLHPQYSRMCRSYVPRRAIPCSELAQQRHNIIPNRVALVSEESVSVVTVGTAPTQTGDPTHAHLHHWQ